MRTDSAARYLLPDALGSTLALTDGSAAVRTEYSYEAYGETTSSGDASTNAFQYTGRENDQTGLYYYRARYYQPGIKRFVSEDPIGLAGGLNLYAYVGGNPTSLTDPLGLEPDVFKGAVTLESGQINVFDKSGNVTSGPAISGPYGNGALPQGTYQTRGPTTVVPISESSYCDIEGNCWWQPISPIGGYPTSEGHTSGLGIHPDGGVPGTLGCIGATGNNTASIRNALSKLPVGSPVLVR